MDLRVCLKPLSHKKSVKSFAINRAPLCVWTVQCFFCCCYLQSSEFNHFGIVQEDFAFFLESSSGISLIEINALK